MWRKSSFTINSDFDKIQGRILYCQADLKILIRNSSFPVIFGKGLCFTKNTVVTHTAQTASRYQLTKTMQLGGCDVVWQRGDAV